MTDKFEVHVLPPQRYAKYKATSYTLAVIQFDIIQDGVPFDNGYNGRYECCDIGLRELVETADAFLENRITEAVCLSFVVPWIAGDYVRYGYYFDIKIGDNPGDNYWVFNITPNFTAEKRELKYSCKLNREQVKALRDSLACQINEFDWENCGKTEFFMFELPDRPYEWCYSARALENTLNELLVGDKLETIYVSGSNYTDPLRVRENFVNYYIGSRVYLEFENQHVDILANAAGLFEIRFFKTCEVKKSQYFDQLEELDEVLCDTGYVFNLKYAGQVIQHIDVEAVEYYPWHAKGFDKSKIGEPRELPESIHFGFENRTELTIAGWDDDFIIQMEQQNMQ